MIRLTERGSKIGVHAQTTRFFDHLRTAAAQGTPFPVAKITQEQTALADVKRDSPDTLTMARVPHEHDGMEGIADETRMNEARALEWAFVIMGYAFRYLALNPLLVQHIDIFELVNEADPNTVDGWYNMGAIMRECVKLGREQYPTIAWGVGSFNAGTPEYDEMQAFIESGILDEGAHGDVVLSVHEGVLDPASPVDAGHGQLIPGAPSVPEGGGALFGRVAYFAQLAGDRMLPVVVSEAYMQGYGDNVEIRRRAEWVDDLYSKLWYVVAWLPFTHSPTDRWQNQDYTPAYPALMEYAAAIRDRHNATGVEPPPPPPPPDPEPIPEPWQTTVWNASVEEQRTRGVTMRRTHGLHRMMTDLYPGYSIVTNERSVPTDDGDYGYQAIEHVTDATKPRYALAYPKPWTSRAAVVELTGPEPPLPLPVPTFTAPIGTAAERATGKIWPGEWTSANTYGNWYRLRDVWNFHTGDDLNLNSPSWDLDRNAPVWAVGAGEVTYAGRFNSNWGNIVIIRHNGFYTRSAHLGRIDVSVGQTVATGQQIGIVGGADVGLPYHLHFDISTTDKLALSPGDWPGSNRTRLLTDYVDPKAFLAALVTVGQPPPPTAPIMGIDVARYQGAMNWQTAYNAGARFAFCKVSEGTTITDPQGPANVAGARAAGVPIGPYHYYRNWVDPIAQADHFVSRIPPGCNLPPVVDFEEPNGAPDDIADRLHRFMGRVAAGTGITRQIIYTRANYWAATVGNPSWAAQHYLWVAHYTSADAPSIPSTWNRWHVWQYTSTGEGARYGAQSPDIDRNRFNGTQAELEAMRVPYRTMPTVGMDLLPYLRGDGRLYEVRNSQGGQERFQSQASGNAFYQTKNAAWEMMYYDENYIYRDVDTSPGGDRFYRLLEDGQPGSLWIPRRWGVGDSYTRSRRVQFYDKNTCQPQSANSGNVTDTMRFVERYDSFTFRTGITLQDVVKLEWVTGGELYYYARGFGLVGWERLHQDPNTPQWSAISEIHDAGARPDNMREVITCL